MIIMTWKDIMKEDMREKVRSLSEKVRRKLEQDILGMIDDLESKAFSYSVDEEQEKTLKEIFATLRKTFKNYPELSKRPVFGGKGRVEGYDMYLKLIRKATSKNAWSAAYNLKKSLLYVLRPYNLPRRLP